MRGFFNRHAETHYVYTFQNDWALHKYPKLYCSRKGKQAGL